MLTPIPFVPFSSQAFDSGWMWFANRQQVAQCYVAMSRLVVEACETAQWARIVQTKFGMPAYSAVASIAVARCRLSPGPVGKALASIYMASSRTIAQPGFD